MPPPPDGGWGWVIVFAGFTINFLNNGSTLSLGVFLETFVTHFETSHQSIAIANSINLGVLMCGMPINSALVNLFGCRKMCFFGGVVYSLGFFLTTLSDNIYIFYFTYGIVLGWSCGLILISWMGLVAFYFEKKRSLANAICTSGAPIGGAAWSPFGSYLLKMYGWKTTFWIFGGVNLLICVLSFLLRPLVLVPESCDTSMTMLPIEDEENSIFGKRNNGDKIDSADESQSHVELTKFRRDSIMSTSIMLKDSSSKAQEREKRSNVKNIIIPTENEIHGRFRRVSNQSGSLHTAEENNENYNQNEKRPSHVNGVLNMVCIQATPQIANNVKSDKNRRHSVIVFGVGDKTTMSLQPERDIFSRKDSYCIVRPLSRVDLFYERSLSRLEVSSEESPNEERKQKSDDKTLNGPSVTRHRRSVASLQRFDFTQQWGQKIEEKKDIEGIDASALPRGSILAEHIRLKKDSILDPEMKKEFDSQTLSLIQTVKTMLDISYLKRPLFLLVSLSKFFGDFSFFIPWTFLPSMMEKKQIDPTKASFLLTFLGITCLISRLISGFILDIPKIPSPVVSTVSTTVAGITMLILPFCYNFETFAIVGSLYGLFSGGYVTSMTIVLVDMFGTGSLVSALGKVFIKIKFQYY